MTFKNGRRWSRVNGDIDKRALKISMPASTPEIPEYNSPTLTPFTGGIPHVSASSGFTLVSQFPSLFSSAMAMDKPIKAVATSAEVQTHLVPDPAEETPGLFLVLGAVVLVLGHGGTVQVVIKMMLWRHEVYIHCQPPDCCAVVHA